MLHRDRLLTRYFWIPVKDPKSLSDEQAEAWIGESYELVHAALPAKVRIPAKKAAEKAVRRS